MRISDLLRSLADMVARAEGGDTVQPAPMPMSAPAKDFTPSNNDNSADADVFVPPLQAKLEILKKSVGLDNVYDGQNDELGDIRKMAGLSPVQQEAADDEPFDG
jgi:hypothetical protein